jgi:hypothetical protein
MSREGPPPSWTEQEPGLPDVLRELQRLFGRARHRPLPILLLALAGAVGVASSAARKIYRFEAEVVLRLREGELDATTAPPTTRRLEEYVTDVVLSSPRLLELIRAEHLYPNALRRSESAAVEAIRGDVTVEAFRNDFLENRGPEDPPRSAYIRLGVTAGDPEQARVIATRLGQILVRHELSRRRADAAREAARAGQDVAEGRRQIAALEESAARTETAARGTRGAAVAAARLELQDLRRRIHAAELKVRDEQVRAAQLEVRAEYEDRAMGMEFELVSTGPEHPRRRLSPAGSVLLTGGIAFLALLVLGALGIGAFDPVVYDGVDARHLGLSPLGHVPAFRGLEAASLRARDPLHGVR